CWSDQLRWYVNNVIDSTSLRIQEEDERFFLSGTIRCTPAPAMQIHQSLAPPVLDYSHLFLQADTADVRITFCCDCETCDSAAGNNLQTPSIPAHKFILCTKHLWAGILGVCKLFPA